VARKRIVSPHPIGRPTKYTPETVKAILAALAEGNTREDSAVTAGIGYSTMREWELTYPEFSESTRKAEAQARQRMVSVVAKVAMAGNWQAAMTFLERRDPDHWGRKDRVDVMMDIRKAVESMTDDPTEVEAAVAEAQRLVGMR
jgi:hypothetical protein